MLSEPTYTLTCSEQPSLDTTVVMYDIQTDKWSTIAPMPCSFDETVRLSSLAMQREYRSLIPSL